MVESLTPWREVGGSIPTSAVFDQRRIYSRKSTGNTQEAVGPYPDMTEKLFTGMLSINTNKTNKIWT